jgi:RNA polymerase sigma-70 factor (ECF subfamily)
VAYRVERRKDPLEALLRDAIEGDSKALDRLLLELRPRLIRSIREWLSVPADVEDCLQEALIAITLALPSFRGESSIAHFAARIALRCARHTFRRARLNSDLARRLGGLEAPLLEPAPAPSDDSLRASRRAALLLLLDELPAAQADAIALRLLLDFSVGEIAAHCGVPVNTVRSRVRLARDALRSRIEGDDTLSELFGKR